MRHPLVYVKDSMIHGKGLFARKSIKAGAVIGEIEGIPASIDGPYVLWLDDDKHGIEVQNLFKYINHNARPNACYYDDLTVVALRDIEKGEEITHHYGECWNE
ncbi:MAG: SET domain-containing protein-lysine N-methyltransferase [Gammaproteobacteria bacterium]|nr:SET domain-containing protein-lysine N-methyltransferase [Gammaproteobacteria bacterium]